MTVYGLSYAANGVTSGAYYSLTLSAGAIVTGSATVMPASLSYTYFSCQQAFQLQAPSGDISVGGPVEADSNNVIAGTIIVSPAINVPLTVQLWGYGGVYDSYTLAAGQEQGSFSWSVAGKSGYPSPSDDKLSAALPQAKR